MLGQERQGRFDKKRAGLGRAARHHPERFLAGIDSADQPFGFSTKFTDHETGLVFYGARYYSPSLGRFLNRDPVGEAGGVNLYGFASNDAINRWDFRGYWDCWGGGYGGGGDRGYGGGSDRGYGGGGGGGINITLIVIAGNSPARAAVRSAASLGQHGMSRQEELMREIGMIKDPPPGAIHLPDGDRWVVPVDDIGDLAQVVILPKVSVPGERGPSTYDKISAGIHSVLGILGGIPVLGIIPDAVDLIYVIAELPFGKSDGIDVL